MLDTHGPGHHRGVGVVQGAQVDVVYEGDVVGRVPVLAVPHLGRGTLYCTVLYCTVLYCTWVKGTLSTSRLMGPTTCKMKPPGSLHLDTLHLGSSGHCEVTSYTTLS